MDSWQDEVLEKLTVMNLGSNEYMWLVRFLVARMQDEDYFSKEVEEVFELSQGFSKFERFKFVKKLSECLKYKGNSLYNNYQPQFEGTSRLMLCSSHMTSIWGEDLQYLEFQGLCDLISQVACRATNYEDIPYLDELSKIIYSSVEKSIQERTSLAAVLSELAFKGISID